MNTDDPKAVANYVLDRLPDDYVLRVENTGQDGDCYIVENANSRFAIGIDEIDGEGISWATYFLTEDGQSDVVSWDGWRFGENANIDQIVSELNGKKALK